MVRVQRGLLDRLHQGPAVSVSYKYEHESAALDMRHGLHVFLCT